MEGGKQSEVKPTAAPVGTTVQVRDLFFNVPARRKFLRTTNTEMAHITEQLTRVALAYSEIHFTLSHSGRKSLELPVSRYLQGRVAGLFGEELAQTLIEAKSDERGVKIKALLAPPGMSKTSGKWQYFFLNGRYIRDRVLSHALRETYRGLMEPSRFPAAFVYLEMAPEAVDVNVHPTKTEVRFRDSHTVHSQVLGTLRETFLKSDLVGKMQIEKNRPDREQEQRVRQAVADYIKSQPVSQERLSFTGKERTGYSCGPEQTRQPAMRSGVELREELNQLFEQDRQKASINQEPAAAVSGRMLQIHKTYILSETAEGMVIVDQHALHERILYEKLKRRVAEGKVASQQLLVPMPIELNNHQQAVLERAKEVLAQVGIELADFGPKTIAVQSFPAMLGKADPGAVVQDIIDRLAEVPGDMSGEELLEPVLASMSCKAAVKAGDELSNEEMSQLLADRKLAEMSSSCPHGRPTMLKMSLAELEKQFKRT
jgi:DNA mismatch repair protein MutL